MERKPILRLSLWLLTFLLFVQPLASMPVDTMTARKAATRFYNWKTGRSVDETHAQLVYTQQTIPHGTTLQTPPITAFYVFDFNGQFVMLSADTRVIPILAYSTESGFTAENMPESLSWILGQYVEEIDFAVRTLSDQECQEAVSAWNRLISGEIPLMEVTASTVSPLLSTQWNQINPYNSQCPADVHGYGGHTHTGCVACAMAQIMRYWSYPVTGFGSHSYTCNNSSYGYGDYGILSVDFSATTYNYDLMPSTLNGATQAQINEVAKLMYHCGVSVDMMYSPYGSGASDNSAVTALRNYFGFDGAVLKYRSSYNATSWSALIKNELNNLRPVYYSGQGTGGHAFVCDGYDNQDLFHFNWGWGGLYDGYFALTSLTPGNDNFTNDQAVIIGVEASQPKIHLETHNMSFLSEANSYSATKTITILGASLPDYIIATVSGNFRISNNGTNFYTSRTVSSGGGTLHVRFQPTGTSGTETGYMVLQSGSIRDTVFLTGNIYDNTPHCLPPTNLRFSTQDLQNISIQWDAPTMDPDPHTLTWTTSNPAMYFGDNYNNYKMSMLQRFCDTDLVAYHNQALTAVSFIPDEDATLYKVVVYKGGSNNGDLNPGTLVLSQDINMSTLNSNTWNTITLNTPIVVDATQELWFGVYLEAPAGTFCMPLSSNAKPKKGCICGTHSPGSVSWSELYENRTFCIRGTVENVQTVTNFQVSRNGTVVGTTTANNIEDHVTGTNTYTYVITANWSNGCSSSVQKSFTNIPGLFATPEVLDFYSNYGHGTVVKTTAVSGIGLSGAIQATVSGNFRISADGATFSTSLSLPASGGTIYVKYTPTVTDSEYETGMVTLTSGTSATSVSLSGQCYKECFPPQDLTLSQSGSDISLGWSAPLIPTTSPQNLSWLTNTYASGTIGIAIQHYFVYRFETADLVSHHGKKLTAISFIPSQGATMYKLVVYKGGSPNGSSYFSSGTKVLEQDVSLSSLTNNVWNTIQLNQPVTIDAGQELWFGIYMEAPSSSPIWLGKPYVAKKGFISKPASYGDNSWQEFTTSNYCFTLKGTIEEVPITFSHYQIGRNQDSVTTTNNTSYIDPLIYNGDYGYDVWAVWSNGCKAAVRDGITVTGLCDHAGETFTETACESYSWNGSTYNQSGEYFYTHYDSNGCPIVDTLLLTVHYGTHNSTTETACESFDWHGQTYTASGTYTYPYTNADGCASMDTLHLTVNHGTHNVETVTACDSYEWNGETFYDSGVQIYEYTNDDGCASADTLILTINQSFNTELSHVMCDGESFDFFNNTITSSGTYTEILQTVNGCDSVITLTMTVNNLSESSLNIDILENELPFTLNGEQYSLPGIYQQTLTNVMGCDSFLTINLTIFFNKFTTFDTIVCDYGEWNGDIYTQSGEYTQMFTSADGSDSTVTMNLTVLHSTHNVESVTVCESYDWNNTTYTISGTYIHEYINDNGCPSADTLVLTVNYDTENTLDFGVLENDLPFTLNGKQYTNPGIYQQTLYNNTGCDSLLTINLTVFYNKFTTFDTIVCDYGEWNGDIYTQSGEYTQMFTAVDGSDSSVTMNLTVLHGTHDVFYETACESYEWHGHTYTTSGTYTFPYTNADGCASEDTLYLTVNPVFNTPIAAEICQGETYSFFGQSLATTGTYTHTLETVHGCDSVITLTLTVNPTFNTPITAEICQGESYSFFGQTLSTAGTYNHTLQTVHGCDSVITLTLTVNPVYNTPISQEICQGNHYNFFGQTLSVAGTYSHTLQSVKGCDSIVTLTLIVNDILNTAITQEICQGETYNFFGQSLTTAGTYTHTLQSVHGCDSVITLTLTVNPTFNTPISAEICQGESYSFFGQALNTAGTYTHTLQSVHGCDSVITLILTVNPTFNTPIAAEICEGETYSFFGQSLATTGTYTHTLETVHGCDSVITLTLTVNPTFNTPITAEICQGESYGFFGQSLSTAGTYNHTLQTVHGCDSVITLTLTVNPVYNTPISQEICQGNHYNFFGQTLSVAGTYSHTLQSVQGCDSIVTLTLIVNDILNTAITQEICQGETYNFFGQSLSTAGTYSHTLQSVHGCDSVVTLTLTVNPVFNTPITAEICQGESYSFFGQTLTSAGTYNHTLESVHGCDSVITLTLTVNPIFNTPISAEICQGETYNFFGQTLSTAGTYTHTLESVHGCDSVITLTLIVNPTINTPITAEICEGETYNFFGQSLTTAGTYTHTLQTVHGCDSIISLTLIVHPTFNTPVTAEICQGETYDFFGQALNTAGTYNHTLQTVHGCDSVITLTLTVNPIFNTPISAEICQGETYSFFGQTLTTAGTYSHTLETVHGCDSVITLTLTVNPTFNTPITAEICQGETYSFFGQTLATAGTYNHTLESVNGCDSVITLTLTVNPIFNTPISAEICQGETYSFFGQTLATAGTYTHTLQSVHGCDSVITLTLTVSPTFNTPISAEICQGESYSFFGQALNTAGTYTHTLQSVHGCDSVITLTLTVNPTFNTPIAAEICEGESYSFFGQTLSTAGTYNHTLQTVHGCDSVITLTLTVNPIFNTPISAEICQGETYNFFGQTLSTAGTYTHTLESVHGCDSVITLTLIVNPTINTPITAEICEGETYNFFGQSLTTAGTYTHTLQTVHGCDSVITLTLIVRPTFNTPVTAEICQGETYNFFGQSLSTAGTYNHTLESVHGCDSIITLTLTVNPTFNTPISAEICQGETYNFFGQALSAAGTYTHTLESVHGCDSIITLTLIVRPTFNTPITAEICQGETYDFFGQSLTTAGTYNHTLESIHGCDSIITLTLTVNPIFNTPISAEICQGETYNFFGQALSTAGTYNHTLESVYGCDSVISLTLIVHPTFNTPVTAEICQGETYNFFGQALSAAGTYTHTLESIHGCDSVITLTLTVNPIFNTPISAEICQGETYDFFGQSLATAGTYSHTLQTVHGCDSVITLTLTVNPTFNTPVTAEICEGETYDFFGQTFTTAGTYNHTLESVYGCDSVITLTLTVNPTFNTPISAEICQGETYDFFGQALSAAGTYNHTLESVHGCDSVITLTLIVNPTINTPITAEICQGETYDFFGQSLTTAGTYNHTLESIHGCDSIITLTLTVNPIFNTPISAEICQGETYNFFGQTLSTAGTYNHTLQTIHGCDSVITLTLTVNPTFNTPVSTEICQGETYSFFGQSLATAGTYSHTLQTVHGCDSVITLTLIVRPTFNTPITAEICQGETYDFFGQSLTTAGTYNHTLESVHGCDSVITLTLMVNPIFNTPVSTEICQGETYSFFGQTLATAGTYNHTLQTVHGCDSVITLTLMVNPIFNTPVSTEICQGETYSFFGQTLATAGTYNHTLQSVHGCDSVITLTLTVNPTFNTPVTHTMCNGETFNFLGNILTTSGTYVDTLQTVNGCDSVVTLTLTVLNTDTADFTEETCDSYTWNGETFTESGDYTVTLTNAAGCDSVVTLHLVINPSFDITVYDTAVRLHEYALGDFQITPEEAGTFTYDLTGTTTAGCDSTVHLVLTVLNNDGIPTNAMKGVEVFPNPTNATLNIKGENMRQIAIYNADGQLVYLKDEEIADLHRVDVSRYAAGQYLVKIIFDNKQSITKKIVVKH